MEGHEHAGNAQHPLRLRRLGIDTYQESVVYMRSDCHVCRAEGFESQSRIRVGHADRVITATLHVVHGELLRPGEAALSEVAYRMLGAPEGAELSLSHAPHLESMSRVRAKVYGEPLSAADYEGIIGDVTSGLYSDIEIACYLTACAARRADAGEIEAQTRAMVAAGARLSWPRAPIADKHCVGGLPGNRTTMIVVPTVAALGITMPKTSSRAITSPAGTADAMETVAPVHLDVAAMRCVVESVGACIVWGGAMHLSPADDILIRVEHALDIDATGQLVASVLSKKVAAGATHAVIDVPWGPTAKVRDEASAAELGQLFVSVGAALGLAVRVALTDGSRPVGRGIGPALEARDVLAVLRGETDAPEDLRERSLVLAGEIIDLVQPSVPGVGRRRAREALLDGRAWAKFHEICEAQGGFREPVQAPLREPVRARRGGVVSAIDNRRIARVAKLAGAPRAQVAGVFLDARVGGIVRAGDPLFTVHADSSGELRYALEYARAHPDILSITEVGG